MSLMISVLHQIFFASSNWEYWCRRGR